MPHFAHGVLALAAALLLLAATTANAARASPPHRVLMPKTSYHTLGRELSGGYCNGGNRTDCGYMGINQEICQSRGCCWKPTQGGNPENLPWCFFQSPPSPSCKTTPACSGHGSCGSAGDQCTCSSGYATCSAGSSDACSVNLSSDVSNCGSCGTKCPSGPGVASSTCSSGKCATTCSTGFILCFGECVQATSCSAAAPFSKSDMATMVGYFMDNIDIQGAGGVAASPSKSDPNYFFHWQRDGAISMREVMSVKTIVEAQKQLQDYTSWVSKARDASDPNNIDVRGEPKFFLGNGGPMGAVYNGGWLRPQNDGCALRTITLLMYAKQLIAAGQKQYVADNIWTSSTSSGVQRDLQYVIQVWSKNSGDPWEEVTGQVFFDKFAHRHALLLGAEMAMTFGDSSTAQLYNSTAALIKSNIMSVHWNPSKGIIMEVPNTRELDSATHLGVLYGYAGDNFLSPASSYVQSSVSVLVDSFKSYTDFTINAKDDAAGVPGLLVGRYLNDNYNGGNPSQPGGGNPWILCTAGLADIYYQAASLHAQGGELVITDANARFFEQAMDFAAPLRAQFAKHQPGMARRDLDAGVHMAIAARARLSLSDPATRPALVRLLGSVVLSGDAILLRLRHHVASNNFHLPEELNKDTGVSQGAHDLTWSYGTVIGAMTSRAHATEEAMVQAIGAELHSIAMSA